MIPDAPPGATLPNLPALDPAALEAVRNSLPGKLLGRTAAILATLVLALGFAELANGRLANLGLILSPPWLNPVLLIGLPIAIIAAQLLNEWRARRNRRQAIQLAIKPALVPEGYFRIGPYLDTEQDHALFSRPDQAHHKVLAWLRQSNSVPCYLTGDSGCGKSSLLNAFVLPELRRDGWTIAVIRAGQDAEAALREHLKASRGQNFINIRDLIEASTRRCQRRLLLVLDQFEEFLILGTAERQETLAVTLADLNRRPINGLKILLGLRSDYQTALEEVGLPRLLQGENFLQVGRFREEAARSFFKASKLGLKDESLDRLLKSAAELDDTPGMIRPVTLNVLGYVLQQRGGGVATSLDASTLVRGYIAQSVENPAVRSFAPPVLEALLTEQGTKRPRLETELAKEAKLRTAEVRAVLHALAGAALTRPLDATQNVWEYSHDFVARAVSRYLGRHRVAMMRRASAYAAPTLLALGIVIGLGALGWNDLAPARTRAELADLGVSIEAHDDGFHVKVRATDDSDFARIATQLATFAVVELDLSGTKVANLEPLERLTGLQRLDLSRTQVTSLDPIQRLTALHQLSLNNTRAAYLEPLQRLTALQQLTLFRTPVTNLEPLKRLTALQRLDVSFTPVTNLGPLQLLTALRQLDLSSTPVANLEPLHRLSELQHLDCPHTRVTDLEPLQGLTALQHLDLSFTPVTNLGPLQRLTALEQIDINNTPITNLEPLREMTALQKLDLTGTSIANLEPVQRLTALQWLYLAGTEVSNSEIERVEQYRGQNGLQNIYMPK